ncbi:hypothetical protein ACUOFC_25150 [Escherichia sp. TWPC-MK]
MLTAPAHPYTRSLI